MPPRPAVLVVLVLAGALLAGCGSATEEGSTRTSLEGSSSPGSKSAAPSAPSTGAPVGASAESCETLAADAEALQATAISCERARKVMYGWQHQPSCALPATTSRGGCRVRSYSCQAVRADRGLAVSCARAGESLAFLARRA